jgi:hypothetical protein
MSPATATGTAAATKSTLMLATRLVPGVADVTLAIASLVAVKVIEGSFAASRHGASVAVVRVVAVVHMAVEATRSMKPRTRSKEHAAGKPIRSIVAIGRAVVRGIVIVSIRAYRGGSNVD